MTIQVSKQESETANWHFKILPIWLSWAVSIKVPTKFLEKSLSIRHMEPLQQKYTQANTEKQLARSHTFSMFL